jgi:3-phenylpropionate/cinnamic acid dioxygenase small subunit
VQLTRQEAEDFLYHEACLLDERRLEEWLELFTEDGIYWIPIDEASDPEQEPSILYDDSLTRAQRVHQLLHQSHYTQMPPSRTVHFISNVRVDGGGDGGETMIRCNVLAFELRPGDQRQLGLGAQRPVAGQCEYRLRHKDRWQISLKKVVLIDRDLPLENFTFIL